MENLNEKIFTKKEEEEEKVPSLKLYSARMVYYINLNTMHILHRTVTNLCYCQCYKFSGCVKKSGFMDYCDMCSLEVKHNSYNHEKNYRIKNLIDKHIELINDFKENEICIHNIDYTFKIWGPYFNEYSFYDSVFQESLFIKKKYILLK